MFVAQFLTGPGTDKTPININISFTQYLYAKWNPHQFIKNLSIEYDKNFLTEHYYIGVKYV